MAKRKKAYAEQTRPKKTRTVNLAAPPLPSAPRTGPMQPPYLPIEVTDVELVFPVGGYGRLPDPSVFGEVDPRFVTFVQQWFYQGAGAASDHIVPKEGIDMKKAVRHLKSVMGTYDTKHEDKINGVAFLMQTWFEWKEAVDG